MIRRLYNRPDFSKNPFLAIARRIYWRLYWRTINKPFQIMLPNGLKIWLSHSGSSALVYYLGWSEPETAGFLISFLKPGMVVVDVGSHVGELSLLSAKIVGEIGSVHCFEPNPDLYRLIKQSIEANNLTNVFANCAVVSNEVGKKEFWIHQEPSLSSLKIDQKERNSFVDTVQINSISLDMYFKNNMQVDLIKVDVEGAELLVFEGAKELLSANNAPVLLFEFSPEHFVPFGYTGYDLIHFLQMNNYHYFMDVAGNPIELENIQTQFSNVVASKNQISDFESLK